MSKFIFYLQKQVNLFKKYLYILLKKFTQKNSSLMLIKI